MHYKNGREAKVGDLVIGITYNTKGIVSGTLLSITPGSDQCSALVGFLQTTRLDEEGKKLYSRAAQVVKVQGTQQHGSMGDLAVTEYKQDYTHCANLLHADDAFNIIEATYREMGSAA
jgi:hypothetical protein